MKTAREYGETCNFASEAKWIRLKYAVIQDEAPSMTAHDCGLEVNLTHPEIFM